jgi:alkylation response protein AidB-like acyl-CoA dehydrogenase
VVEPFLASAVLAGSAIAAAGNESQRQQLAGIIDGTRIAAFAHAEPDSRYELARVSTRAKRKDKGWVLDGAKAVVLHGDAAGVFVVSARTLGEVDDEAGISLFLVDADSAGLSLRGYPLIDGGRAAELYMHGVSVGADALLGREGEAHAVVEAAIGRGVLALCAESLGAMDAAKEATLEYLRTRKQFGVPIGSFQALQHRMADMLMRLEQARSMSFLAASSIESTDARSVSAAKSLVGRAARFVGQQAVQLHGGIGVTDEVNVSHYFKRLTAIDASFGDSAHHLARYSDAMTV